MARQRPASRRDVEAALDGYAAEMAEVRSHGLMRDLSIDAVERIFALEFALAQLRQNFNDLERCVAEISGHTDRNEPQLSARVRPPFRGSP